MTSRTRRYFAAVAGLLLLVGNAAHAGAQQITAPLSEIPTPKRIKGDPPVYPAGYQPREADDIVLIRITIDTTGRVADARILRSVPGLDEVALSAVRQWEYEPFGIYFPVPSTLTVTVNFSATGAGGMLSASEPVTGLGFLKNSTFLAIASKSRYQVWDTSGKGLAALWTISPTYLATPRAMSVNGLLAMQVEVAEDELKPEGATVAFATHVFGPLPSLQSTLYLTPHAVGPVERLSFSDDGRTLARLSRNGDELVVHVWEMLSGRLRSTIRFKSPRNDSPLLTLK